MPSLFNKLKTWLGKFRKQPSPYHDAKKHYDRALVQKASGRKLPSFAQLRHIGRFLTRTDRIVLGLASLTALVSLAILGRGVYLNHVIFVPTAGGEYTEAVVGRPQFVNPLLSPLRDADADVTRLIFSGLFAHDANQKLVPSLAESYEISDDKKTYTIQLQKNVEWHDGKPFDAEDVVYTFSAVTDRALASPLSQNFSGVRIEKVDDFTVRFLLDQPFAPFLESLTLGILPAHIWQNIPAESFPHAIYNLKKPIGTGAYKLEKFVQDERGSVLEYTLVRNKKFKPEPPRIERIKLKFYPDFATAVEALNSKQVEGLSFVPNELKNAIQDNRIEIKTFNLPQYRAAFFNLDGSEVVKDAAVRKALAFATDKQSLIREALQGDGVIVSGPILSGFLGYNPGIPQYFLNLETAAKLLDDAGWKSSPETKLREKIFKEKDGRKTVEVTKPLELMITTVDREDFRKTAELLAAQWGLLGAKVNVNPVSSETIQRDVLKPRAFDVLVYDEILGGDPDPYAFWHSSQSGEAGLNLSRYANREADALLEAARSSTDPEQRAEKYRDFQTVLMQDLPAIFLASPKYAYAISSKVQGVETDRIIHPSDRFSNITNWYIKVRRSWR